MSRTFNTPELLNQQTKARVLEVAARLNYHPQASRTRMTRSHRLPATQETTIGFQFFAAEESDTLGVNAFYSPVLAGAQAEAAALGLNLLVQTTSRHQMASELPKMIREQAVAGMLLVGTADPEILTAFMEQVSQIVLVDHRDSTGQHDCILSDGFRGMLMATRYLLEIGHRRIGFLLGDVRADTFQDRLHGYLAAHFEAGLAVAPEAVISFAAEDFHNGRFHDHVAACLQGPFCPTALVTANDDYASSVMAVCRRLGMAIPEDLSLIGFDDVDFSAHTFPPLTTIRVNKESLGRLAVRHLYARLQRERQQLAPEPPIVIEVPVSLTLRQSCRPLFPPSKTLGKNGGQFSHL